MFLHCHCGRPKGAWQSAVASEAWQSLFYEIASSFCWSPQTSYKYVEFPLVNIYEQTYHFLKGKVNCQKIESNITCPYMKTGRKKGFDKSNPYKHNMFLCESWKKKEGLMNQAPTIMSCCYFWQEGAEADQYFVS